MSVDTNRAGVRMAQSRSSDSPYFLLWPRSLPPRRHGIHARTGLQRTQNGRGQLHLRTRTQADHAISSPILTPRSRCVLLCADARRLPRDALAPGASATGCCSCESSNRRGSEEISKEVDLACPSPAEIAMPAKAASAPRHQIVRQTRIAIEC